MSTYEDASLIYYPSGYKASKAYSLKPTDGSADLTFTRASSATRVNESGLIESVATGVPRIDYTGGGCGKLLLEPQRTNSILYSQEIDNAYWTKVNLAVSANVISSLDPSGLNTAELITATSGVSQSEVSRSVTTINATPYVFSFFGKKGSGATDLNSFRVLGSGTLNTVTINWDTGAITQSGSGATSVNMGNGWYRIIIPFTANSTSTVLQLVSFQVYPLNVSSLRWGIQLEQGSYPTSYIPTLGTAVTRVADKSSTTGVSSLIGQTEGTIYLEGIAANINADLVGVNRSTSNAIFITKSNLNAFRCYVYAGGVNLTFADLSANTDFFKLAITYKSGNSYLYINGVKIGATNTSTFTFSAPLNILELAGNYFVGVNEQKIQGLMIFQTAKSEAEVAALTTL